MADYISNISLLGERLPIRDVEAHTEVMGLKSVVENMKVNPPMYPNASQLYVGKRGAKFSTINDAIEYAKGYCHPTNNRVTIFVTAGTYRENIHLVPNPGIDIIGLGDVILRSNQPYPYSPIFTTGAGYFENLYCVNESENSYGLHIERSSGNDVGDLTFRRCTFVASGTSSGAGIGMSGGLNLNMYDCYLIGYNGLYIHNSAVASDSQYANFRNCRFEASDGKPVWIDDAAQMAGAGVSRLLLSFTGCFSQKRSITIRYTNSKSLTYFDPNEANILIASNSCGNNMIALNYGIPMVITFTTMLNENRSAYYTLPYDVGEITINDIDIYVQGTGYVGGSVILSQGNVVAIQPTGTAGSNAIAEVTLRMFPS